MTTHTISEQCPTCDGTGLYTQGMAELKSAAVVCRTCKGTGEHQHPYTPFTGKRPPPPDITKVYSHNASTHLLTPDVPGGVTIEEWIADADSAYKPGTEVRTGSCPLWWFSRSHTDETPPKWPECITTGPYMKCLKWGEREGCWERWDHERAEKK